MASEYAEAALEPYRERVEAAVREALTRPEGGELLHMAQYHQGLAPAPDGSPPGSGGKRLRGILCLLASEVVGGEADQAAPAAAAVELLHGFTLLHDDIADRDVTRRGRPTVWRMWGEGQAITAGDAMYARANLALGQLLAEGAAAEVVVEALLALNEATLAVCEGQQLDLAYEGRDDVSVDDYVHMIELKTASLFAASAGMGAAVGGGGPAQVESLRQFGQWLGLAFQVQDDLLGLWGEEETLGKPVGSDLRRNKRSLPILYALGLDHPVRARLAAALAAGVESDAEARALAADLEAAGVREHVQSVVQWHLRQAEGALGQPSLLPEPVARLRLLVEHVTARRR